jgi:hypothetical protein
MDRRTFLKTVPALTVLAAEAGFGRARPLGGQT